VSSAKRWPVLLTLFCIPARAWEEEVVVRDERPVAAAIELLQERFRVPITYEDPPYLYRGPLPVQERTPPRCHPRAAGVKASTQRIHPRDRHRVTLSS